MIICEELTSTYRLLRSSWIDGGVNGSIPFLVDVNGIGSENEDGHHHRASEQPSPEDAGKGHCSW